MLSYFDEKIIELRKKLDVAQRSGNYATIRSYDRQIQILQNQRFKLILSTYNVKQNNVPQKTKKM